MSVFQKIVTILYELINNILCIFVTFKIVRNKNKAMNKSILLVDDKPEVAKIIKLYLTGYNVEYAEDPLKAIEWLNINKPDVIISDLNMPGMSGEDFLCYLKDKEELKAIPVLILSSVDNSACRIRLFEEGAADFILKPFNPEELRVRIKMLIQ